MKIANYLLIALISLCIASCSKVADPIKKIGLGSRAVNYETNENVDSLVIPPDLTAPSSQGSFTKVIEVDDSNVLKRVQNVEVKRDKYRRWLLVDLPPIEVWALSKEYFRSYGFTIEKENQKIGLLETDYLEIETKVPEKSLGSIRTALAKALKTKYGLPIADKYRIRIEPTANPMESEVYLTLSSIGEVVSGAMRVWQPREKDVELETEMLLKFMVYLGTDTSKAVEQINSENQKTKLVPTLVESSNGVASLTFPYDKKQSWRYLGWALDELNIEIEDRDNFDGTYYIKIPKNKNFFVRLISTSSDFMTYKLLVKEVNKSFSEVVLSDLSGQDKLKTIEFSYEFFENILDKF